MAKFIFFEYIVLLVSKHVFTARKETYGKTTQLSVTCKFAWGYLLPRRRVVSYPAYSLLSLVMGKPANLGDGGRDEHRCACDEGVER